jgi:hypothetical protein
MDESVGGICGLTWGTLVGVDPPGGNLSPNSKFICGQVDDHANEAAIGAAAANSHFVRKL